MARLIRRTRTSLRTSLLTLAVGFAAACGGSDNTGPVGRDPVAEVVASVALTAPTTTLAPQQAVQFTSVAKNASGGIIGNVTPVWSSSATNVATVTAAGIVTGVSAGTANIVATSGTKSAMVAVTVSSGAGVLASVVANLQDRNIQLGQNTQASIAGRDGQGSAVALGTRTVTWTTNNPAIASVSSAGIVTGVGIGTVDIQASVADGAVPRTNSVQLIVESIPGAATSATVTMAPQDFIPFETVIRLNGTVNFVFPTLAHNVMWDRVRTGSPADINTISNMTVSRTFATVGVFGYKCTLHPGMEGRIIVTP